MSAVQASPPAVSRRPPAGPRTRHGYWAVAFAFFVVFAASTVPSPLYVLYATRDHLAASTITLIYAAYAIGVIASLFFAGHLSDAHGRRPHLLAAVAVAVAACAVFLIWPQTPGLFLARILSGLSVGLCVSTATAWLNELHAADHGTAAPGRPQLTATVANLGGLGTGALVAGLLAELVRWPLVVPYVVLSVLLLVAAVAVAAAPETRRRPRPLPRYRPQRIVIPPDRRPSFVVALLGVFVAYAGPAVFLGLSGTFLARALHERSPALTGVAVFVVFVAGVAALAVARSRPGKRLLTGGAALEVAGLGLVVASAWLPTPSLALFLFGGAVLGAGSSLLFKATLEVAVASSAPERLGETLAGFFLVGYLGLSLPVIAVGFALQALSPRVALLAFGLATVVATGAVVAAQPRADRARSA